MAALGDGEEGSMRAPLYSANPNELFDPATFADPQRLYARLRSEAPMARVADTGVHLLATWDLIEEALHRESDFSANLTGVLMRSDAGDPTVFDLLELSDGRHVLATADEPEHSVHRSTVQPRFATAFVAALERTARRWAREAVSEWLAGGAGDFVPVAELVPALVLGDLLGLPEGDVSRHREWAMFGGEILAGDIDLARLGLLATESLKMQQYLGEHLELAGEDLRPEADAPVMHCLARGVRDGRITRDGAIGIAAIMFSAGGESTAALIATAVRWLAERPGIASALREDPERVPRFVEEVARLDPPFNFHYRAVRRSCQLGGYELHAGDRLMLLWASANRDPAHVDDPDEFRLDRKHPKHHMTYGRGSHFCIGAPIARLEARLVCEELLRATEEFAPRPGHPPVYARSITVRRLECLPLDARPSGAGPG